MAALAEIIAVPGFADPVSSWTHLAAAVGAAALGLNMLRAYHGSFWRLVRPLWGPLCFVASAIFLFSMSGTYHLLDHGGPGREVMQRMDHAAIWVLIAGTYTAIHHTAFKTWFWRWGVPALIWAMAITGLVLKTVFFHDMPEVIGTGFYLILGWLGVLSGWKLKREGHDRALRLMILGGVAYSVGAVIEAAGYPTLISGVIGPHELFHVAVVAGVLLHWRCVKAMLPVRPLVVVDDRPQQLTLPLWDAPLDAEASC